MNELGEADYREIFANLGAPLSAIEPVDPPTTALEGAVEDSIDAAEQIFNFGNENLGGLDPMYVLLTIL